MGASDDPIIGDHPLRGRALARASRARRRAAFAAAGILTALIGTAQATPAAGGDDVLAAAAAQGVALVQALPVPAGARPDRDPDR